MRFRAIYKAIYHGLMPYWFYEKECHYQCSYLEHLWINLQYAWRWISFSEYQSDIEFEQQTNFKMKNYRLEYLSLFQGGVLDNMNVESEIEEADDGEPSSAEEGKQEVLSQVQHYIKQLQDFEKDVNELSFKKLETKYSI